MAYKILHLPTATYIYHIKNRELDCSYYLEHEIIDQGDTEIDDYTTIYKFSNCLRDLIGIISFNSTYFSKYSSIPEHFELIEVVDEEI